MTAPVAVILDSGCGTGESTIHIARRFPAIPVIGIDKSCDRLNKAGNPSQTAGEDVPRNAFWIRAELLDFWRLALDRVKAHAWTIPYHAVYYPNPWPKQSEATRRFHMHPIFPTLLALGGVTELRTNWEIYAREFAEAARIVLSENGESTEIIEIKCETFTPASPETAFERKYKDAGQTLWKVVIAALRQF
jgi:tRNA G46 methylase TrmB